MLISFLWLSIFFLYQHAFLSVHPSIEWLYKSRQTIFTIILVFLWTQTMSQYLKGGCVKYRDRKNLQFSTEIALYLGNGTRQAYSYYGSLTEVTSTQLIPVTVDDLERWDERSPVFPADACTVNQVIKFSTLTHAGVESVYNTSAISHLKRHSDQ